MRFATLTQMLANTRTSQTLETLGEIVPLKGLPPISIRENDTNGWIRL
ncbi:unnamed protein product [marine sediment metagenome]|uniref:Uncharacterized protein n=1 Tax=marine sediment metagenome TaxID=412755 RepID=X1QJ32_9ZZZZ